MKTIGNILQWLIIIFFIVIFTIAIILDRRKYKYKVKIYYQSNDTSIEYFKGSDRGIEHHFIDGCISDMYGKNTICGIRKIEVLSKVRIK